MNGFFLHRRRCWIRLAREKDCRRPTPRQSATLSDPALQTASEPWLKPHYRKALNPRKWRPHNTKEHWLLNRLVAGRFTMNICWRLSSSKRFMAPSVLVYNRTVIPPSVALHELACHEAPFRAFRRQLSHLLRKGPAVFKTRRTVLVG